MATSHDNKPGPQCRHILSNECSDHLIAYKQDSKSGATAAINRSCFQIRRNLTKNPGQTRCSSTASLDGHNHHETFPQQRRSWGSFLPKHILPQSNAYCLYAQRVISLYKCPAYNVSKATPQSVQHFPTIVLASNGAYVA